MTYAMTPIAGFTSAPFNVALSVIGYYLGLIEIGLHNFRFLYFYALMEIPPLSNCKLRIFFPNCSTILLQHHPVCRRYFQSILPKNFYRVGIPFPNDIGFNWFANISFFFPLKCL